ncbi:uncharacterized protein METZ01_LOCUS350213, partial [marine metagenome]
MDGQGWPEHCFKAYDIRGIAGSELTEKFAHRLGLSLATYLDVDSMVVGRDIRNSSPELAIALMDGLSAGGVDVLDIGVVPTGCLYHAVWNLPVHGGVMVTASHLSMRT